MNRFFKRLGIFIANKRLLFIIIGILLIIPAIIGATQLEMETGYSTFISEDAPEYQDYELFNNYFSDNVLAVLLTGDDLAQLLDPENLAAMEALENEMGGNADVLTAVGPAFYIKQAMYEQIGIAALPDDLQTVIYIVTDPASGEIRPEFAGVFPDAQHALIAITLNGGLSPETEADVVDATREAVAEAGFHNIDTLIAGSPVIWSGVTDLMLNTLQNMLIVSIGLMLLILALIFIVRGVFAWRWLPLLIVFIGIIYTFGVMGVLSVPITMATMAVFPIIVGLGVDYSIQLYSRYDEECIKSKSIKEAIVKAVAHIGPVVGIALITACLGFFALYFSPVTMIQDFGSMLIIGVTVTYLLSVFFLMAILYSRDRKKDLRKKDGENLRKSVIGIALIAMVFAFAGIACTVCLAQPSLGDYKDILIILAIASTTAAVFSIAAAVLRRIRSARIASNNGKVTSSKSDMHFIERILHKMAPHIIKNPAVILPLALILTVAGVVADGYIETETEELNFISSDVQFFQDIKTLNDITGGFTSAHILIQAEDVTQPEVLEWMLQLESQILGEHSQMVGGTSSIAGTVAGMTGGQIPADAQQIKGIVSSLPTQVSRNFVTDNYMAANIIVSLNTLIGSSDTEPFIEALKEYVSAPPEGVSAVITGQPVIGQNLLSALTGGRAQMTLIGIGLVFGGVLILFRFRILRALMATLPIALIIGWSSGVMYLMGIKYTPLTSTLSALIIGIGVEFTILLMMRYYEERKRGEGPSLAMVTAITKIGRAIVASGLTTIGGFGALLIAKDFAILSDFGVVTMVNVTFALISTLFVLPPLIVWVDSWTEKRRSARRRSSQRRRSGKKAYQTTKKP